MTCYFADYITLLPTGLQFGDKGFSHAVVCQLLICVQKQEAMDFMILTIVFSLIRTFVYHISDD